VTHVTGVNRTVTRFTILFNPPHDVVENTLTASPSIETQHGHPGIVLATVSLADVMVLLDLFVVNVGLHD
jgi:hypothetical protein